MFVNALEAKMLGRGKNADVLNPVVNRNAISVVNVTAFRTRSVNGLPNRAVKSSMAVSEITLFGMKPVELPGEELGDGVKDDRIIEFDRRDAANLHPFAVKNK
jgi:hypothetical protein